MKAFFKNKKYLCALLLLLCILITVPTGVTLAKYYTEIEHSFTLDIRKSPPVLAQQRDWFDDYRKGIGFSSVKTITFAKEPPATYTTYWDASAAQDESVICYSDGENLTIVGDKELGVYANPTSNSVFASFENLTTVSGLENFDTSMAKVMNAMFWNCPSLKEVDLSSFDTSNVTDMQRMFLYCKSLKSLDLSSFDTSKVTNMEKMFNSCSSLESLYLEHFDTSSVTDMESMFADCDSLTDLQISTWDTSNVTTFYEMFRTCNALTTLDLTTKVINEGTEDEYIAWDVSKVGSVSYMFRDCRMLKQLWLGDWNLPNSVNATDTFLYLGYDTGTHSGAVVVATQEQYELFSTFGGAGQYASIIIDESLVVE